MASPSKRPIVVVGAGVIGLTTAVVLRERGYPVVLLGRDLPTDASSQQFASVWAGANWCSYAGPDDLREQKWETVTWEHWMKTKEERPDLIALIPFLQYLPVEVKKENVWFSDLCPNFRTLGHIDDGFDQKTFALAYDSLTAHVPHLLQYLLERATQGDAGPSSSPSFGPPVQLHRIPEIPSLAAALSALPEPAKAILSSAPDANPIVVNATGLGARNLSDVLDPHVHPARGQTVLIRAPRVKRCVVHAGKESKLNPAGSNSSERADTSTAATHEGTAAPAGTASTVAEADQPNYVIPRAQGGDVILGGTYQEDRLVFEPELRTTLRILANCHSICPEIATPYGQHTYRLPPSGTSSPSSHPALPEGKGASVWSPRLPERLLSAAEARASLADEEEAVEILRVNVGMRPARRGGARLERSVIRRVAVPASTGLETHERDVQVVHAYGFGPAGYQQGWGVAHAAADLVEEACAQ